MNSRRRLRRFLQILNATLVVLIMFAANPREPVSAHNYGSSNCGPNLELSNCVARDRLHYLWYDTLTPQMAVASDDTARYVFRERTQLEMSRTATYGTHVDVNVYDGNYGSGYWGVTFCPQYSSQGGTNPYRWCRPFVVRFNNGYYPSKFDSVFERDVIACHELGHTTGLRDRDYTNSLQTSCMIDNAFYSDYLSEDDEMHLNDRY